ncbi:potassium transporter TrkG, partial [uncultured Alloprevotella sp.]
IYKVIVREFKRMLHPHAVFPIRISGTLISNGVVRNIFVFITLYIILTALGTTAMMAMGLTMLDSVSCCITCLSSVGPGYGYVVGPLDSWDVFPDAVLWIDSFLMLAGRLEIYSILLPFMPGFWRDN